MGLFNMIFGNASEMDPEDLKKEFTPILCEGEQIEAAFKLIRDKWVFTNKRLIMLNVEGVTGFKRDYHSLPYRSITQFCVETAGTLDDDCHMKIWVKGATEPFVKEFGRGTNVKAIQRVLAHYVL